ncbi:MAG: linear amide C-N hydrolase [Stappiaceae bacterium]
MTGRRFSGHLRGLIRLPVGLLMFLTASAALACSTVVLGSKDRAVVAYSFDYEETGEGFVFINPAHARRRSVMQGSPAEWAVRYGSVSFNQLGPGMPAAGMNTQGLVVTLMWNNAVVYEQPTTEPVVNELEFIQRLLDQAATVPQALEVAAEVDIDGIVPIHYFLADRSGRVAIITPSANGLEIRRSGDMPVPALTNNSYSDLVGYMLSFSEFGGERKSPDAILPEGPDSQQRFVIAARSAAEFEEQVEPEQGFDVLDRLAGDETRWQIVFDPTANAVNFRISGRKVTQRLDFTDLNFDCQRLPLSAQLDGGNGADFLSRLTPVDPALVTATTHTVLASLSDVTGMGPDVAKGLTMGLLASLKCEDPEGR